MLVVGGKKKKKKNKEISMGRAWITFLILCCCEGATFFASPSGSASADCLSSSTACDLNTCVSKAGAAAGSTISLSAGTFPLSATLTASVTFQGQHRTLTFLVCPSGATSALIKADTIGSIAFIDLSFSGCANGTHSVNGPLLKFTDTDATFTRVSVVGLNSLQHVIQFKAIARASLLSATACLFQNNVAVGSSLDANTPAALIQLSGAGGTVKGSVSMTGCEFTGNTFYIFDPNEGAGCIQSGNGLEGTTLTDVVVSGCLFQQNSIVTRVPGGACNTGGACISQVTPFSTMSVTNSQFLDNASCDDAPGIKFLGSTGSLTNVLFQNNAADVGPAVNNGEGALFATNTGGFSMTLSMTNVTFRGNKAPIGAGAAFGFNSGVMPATITGSNLYFLGNKASGRGGAFIVDPISGTFNLVSTYFCGNTDSTAAGDVAVTAPQGAASLSVQLQPGSHASCFASSPASVSFDGTSQPCATPYNNMVTSCTTSIVTPADNIATGKASVATFIGGSFTPTTGQTITGDVYVEPGATINVTPSSPLVATGNVVIYSGASAVVSSSSSGNLVIVSGASVKGSFSNVTLFNSQCPTVTTTLPQTTTATSISVLVTLSQQCGGSGGLSGGQIAGIVVGSVVGGLLVAVAIALITRAIIRHREMTATEAIKARQLDVMRQ